MLWASMLLTTCRNTPSNIQKKGTYALFLGAKSFYLGGKSAYYETGVS